MDNTVAGKMVNKQVTEEIMANGTLEQKVECALTNSGNLDNTVSEHFINNYVSDENERYEYEQMDNVDVHNHVVSAYPSIYREALLDNEDTERIIEQMENEYPELYYGLSDELKKLAI